MGNRLFVGNLPFDATESQVRDLIAGGGRTVHSVKIVSDKETGRSRGFAFVDVEDDAQAQSAITDLNGKDFNGRAVVVNEAQERGHGGGGKFGGGGGFRGPPHGKEERRGGGGGFCMRGQAAKRGSHGGGRRGGRRGRWQPRRCSTRSGLQRGAGSRSGAVAAVAGGGGAGCDRLGRIAEAFLRAQREIRSRRDRGAAERNDAARQLPREPAEYEHRQIDAEDDRYGSRSGK